MYTPNDADPFNQGGTDWKLTEIGEKFRDWLKEEWYQYLNIQLVKMSSGAELEVIDFTTDHVLDAYKFEPVVNTKRNAYGEDVKREGYKGKEYRGTEGFNFNVNLKLG